MTDEKKLSRKLKNIGPVMAARMIAAGIDSPAALRELGSIRAYEKMYDEGDSYGDFNAAYLFALEGAIRNCDWCDIPESIQLKYKQYAQLRQRDKHGAKQLDG